MFAKYYNDSSTLQTCRAKAGQFFITPILLNGRPQGKAISVTWLSRRRLYEPEAGGPEDQVFHVRKARSHKEVGLFVCYGFS